MADPTLVDDLEGDEHLDEILDSAIEGFGNVDLGVSVKPVVAQEVPKPVTGPTQAGPIGLGLGLAPKKKKPASVTAPAPVHAGAQEEIGLDKLTQLMSSLLGNGEGEDHMSALKGLMAESSASGADNAAGTDIFKDALRELEAETRKTVSAMESAGMASASGQGGPDSGRRSRDPDTERGLSDTMQSMVDDMMRQLLSKEMMYEPLMEIGDRYPGWLEANSGKLSAGELRRYERQHELIREILSVYDSRPGDFSRIVELMQQMQECGQPPEEIVKEMAPGMELGGDGLPKLGSADCSIM
eukprot:jgi/Mesvir1/26665/Mv20450-RA.1